MSISQITNLVDPDEVHAVITANEFTNAAYVRVALHDDELTTVNILTTSVTYLAEAAHELLSAAAALADEQGLTFHDESERARVELDHLLGWWRAVESMEHEHDYCGPTPDEGCQGFGCLGHLNP